MSSMVSSSSCHYGVIIVVSCCGRISISTSYAGSQEAGSSCAHIPLLLMLIWHPYYYYHQSAASSSSSSSLLSCHRSSRRVIIIVIQSYELSRRSRYTHAYLCACVCVCARRVMIVMSQCVCCVCDDIVWMCYVLRTDNRCLIVGLHSLSLSLSLLQWLSALSLASVHS
jgi:hypothetical protein